MTLRHFQIFLYVHDEGGMSRRKTAYFPALGESGHSRDGRALWNEAL